METLQTLTQQYYSSLVDTSRPFRSVKEAVAIFGERILVPEIYYPKPCFTPPTPSQQTNPSPWMFSSPSSIINPNQEYEIEHNEQSNNNIEFSDTLKKIEADLEQTKTELKLLKERGSETEIAVASLNAELHKNMSKLAEAEVAAAAKKAAAATRRVSFQAEEEDEEEEEKKKKRENTIRMESSPRLANILSISEEKGYFGRKKEKKLTKKKPIVPLVGDFFFFRKKGSSNKTLNNPLYASAHGCLLKVGKISLFVSD